jgi:hypothetical protein
MKNQKTVNNFRAITIIAAFFCLLIAFPMASFGQEPLEGKTKIEDAKPAIENQLLGNISTGRGAGKVADAIRYYNPNIKAIVLYNKEQAEFLAGYEKTLDQLQDLSFRYASLLNQQNNVVNNLSRRSTLAKCSQTADGDEGNKNFSFITGGLGAASEAVKAFVNLTSFFRTDVELRPETFNPDEKVVISEVFRALRERYGSRIRLYDANSIPPSFPDSEMIKLLKSVIKLDEDVSFNNSLIRERLAKLECKDDAELIDEKLNLSRLVNEYQRNSSQLEMLIKSLTGEIPPSKAKEDESDDKPKGEADDKAKPNFLTAYLRVEKIYQLVRKVDGGYWLEIKAIKAGGTTRVKTNLIVDVFNGGNRVSHSGGSVVEYHLYDKDGFSVLSGIVPDYIPYTKPKKIPNLMDKIEEEKLAQSPERNNNPQAARNTPSTRPVRKN